MVSIGSEKIKLFKQLPHSFTRSPAGNPAADPFGHLLRAAAGDGLEVAKQAGQFVEKATGFVNAHYPFLLS